MPTQLGAHNERVTLVQSLRVRKGRRANGLYALEGSTMLHEALEAGVRLESVYATAQAYAEFAAMLQTHAADVPVFIVDERTMRKMSDVETPSGLLAVTPIRNSSIEQIFSRAGTVLVLADVNDPGNAGTLLRSAQAFGVDRVIFGAAGVDPHHPKVVRAAMGALLRTQIAVAEPSAFRAAAKGWHVTGLSTSGAELQTMRWEGRDVLVVGNERRGLGEWAAACTRLAAISMLGRAESLNAAVAGSIALYEATKRP